MGLTNFLFGPKLPPTANLSAALKTYISAVQMNKNSANISNVKNKMNQFILAAKGTATPRITQNGTAPPVVAPNGNSSLLKNFQNLKNAINKTNQARMKNLANAVNTGISRYNGKNIPAPVLNSARKNVKKARALQNASANVLSKAKAFMNKAKAYRILNGNNANAYSANLQAKYNALGNLQNVFKNNYLTINGMIKKRPMNGTNTSAPLNIVNQAILNKNFSLLKNANSIVRAGAKVSSSNNSNLKNTYKNYVRRQINVQNTNSNKQKLQKVLNDFNIL
jgi:hypothetical protein